LDPSTDERPGRNDPCHCGSGRKYKQCHLDKDEAALRAARAKESQAAAPADADKDKDKDKEARPAPAASAAPKHATHQPWKKASTNTRGFQRMSAPRKVGSG
jgi:hypothetical protein